LSTNLDKTYNPKDIEDKIYSRWLENGYFHTEIDKSKKPFTTVMPPPNITGKLHMGHALDNTLQDIIIRYKRMAGYNALWVPGTDHAAISTEVKITNMLKDQGIDKHDIGREKFLEYAWQWKDEYAGMIEDQLKKLGVSCDWERERFTMDEGCSEAVLTTFMNLYEKGYIYRGPRIINWCPHCHTSLSDAEVIHKEQDGFFWHIKYPIAQSDDYLEIATTRPETMLGDTAIAVHPDDDRYKDLVGKFAILPLVNRQIPIVADAYVDMEFGTGAVKITPSHDPNDFEVGKRHNLEEINVLTDDAHINENGGKYQGLERYEARRVIVDDLKKEGYLVKVVPHSHAVGTHDRCGTTVEPMIKDQWFVAMEELAKPALDAIKNGDLKFVPERFDKTYVSWLENIRDWCISRQIWWGHRIPAYYCEDCGEIVVARSMPVACPKCGGHHFKQDDDTLDTWFSSALWPFSTLGWPEETEDFKQFYPTNCLVTGYDIIFFWVIRMVFSGYEQTGKSPFDTVFIHGLVRDEQGRKMSKSLGNGIDPLEVIDKYGADALRMMLVTGNSPGNDMRFSEKKVEASRNFANKVWNASRFILMNLEDKQITIPKVVDYKETDLWIISKANKLIKDVTENIEKFELGIALAKIYDFLWDEFCDWYIEFVKYRMYHEEEDPIATNAARYTLVKILVVGLKLLHPYMPFVSEEIYSKVYETCKDMKLDIFNDTDSLMMSNWPVPSKTYEDLDSEEVIEHLKDIIRGIRNKRNEMNVPNGRKASVYVVCEKDSLVPGLKKQVEEAKLLANASDFIIQQSKEGIDEDAVSLVVPSATVCMPLSDLVDFKAEVERLTKEKDRIEKEIKRASGMLSNEKFTSKAPEAKVLEEKTKLTTYQDMLEKVIANLDSMKSKM
jgi:valyl-tRNA synthetase